MEERNGSVGSEVSASGLLAFESLKEELARVPLTELVHINVDITTAVTSVLHSLRAVQEMRERVMALPEFELAQFDKLEIYARACAWSHATYAIASRPAESMPELIAEATKLRDMLYSDAMALAHRGLLDAANLQGIKSAIGYRPLANDLAALMALLRANWERVKAKTAVDESDLAHARQFHDRILDGVSQKEQAPTSTLAQASLDRQRAYTLFFRAYEQVRRALAYLRWKENDVELIVPSLFAGRPTGRRRAEEPEAPEQEPAAAVPAIPAPSVHPSIPAGIVPVPAPTSNNNSVPIPIGMPGADPYIRS